MAVVAVRRIVQVEPRLGAGPNSHGQARGRDGRLQRRFDRFHPDNSRERTFGTWTWVDPELMDVKTASRWICLQRAQMTFLSIKGDMTDFTGLNIPEDNGAKGEQFILLQKWVCPELWPTGG